MKKTNKKKELDVDFIGDPSHPLTKEEEKAISTFIKASKLKLAKLQEIKDVRLYDKAKSRKQQFTPAEKVFKRVKKRKKV